MVLHAMRVCPCMYALHTAKCCQQRTGSQHPVPCNIVTVKAGLVYSISWDVLVSRSFLYPYAYMIDDAYATCKQMTDCLLGTISNADKLKAAGHDVELSKGAGRYLCNYIYFRSLLNCTSIPNWHALFVHLPPLKCVGEEQQLALALDLFDTLCADVQLQQV